MDREQREREKIARDKREINKSYLERKSKIKAHYEFLNKTPIVERIYKNILEN